MKSAVDRNTELWYNGFQLEKSDYNQGRTLWTVSK